MKFVNYLKEVDNIQYYPAVSLILFILVFCLVVWHTFSLKNEDLAEQSEIPLK